MNPKLITVPPRQRKDVGDLSNLKASIKTLGLLEPIVVTPDNQLVAGERRLRACLELQLADVPVHVLNLQGWHIPLAELEENIRRKEYTWQEQVCAIADVHNARTRDAAARSESWGMSDTGNLLGVSNANVCYCTQLAERLRANDTELLGASGVTDAYRILCERKLAEAQSRLVGMATALPTTVTAPAVGEPPPGEACATLVVPQRPAGLHCTLSNQPFEEWKKTVQPGAFTHIYTDPPYAIDMDNLSQDGVGMQIDNVRETHNILQNTALLGDFIDWACHTLPDNGWLVVWCDYTMWDTLVGWIGEDLRVQRWPLVWIKQNQPCMNAMPYSNFTKTHECALVACGCKATLSVAGPFAHWLGTSDKTFHNPTNPFWKPIQLHHYILDAISRVGDTICDPFAGSGSIPYACQRSGRSVLANEVDPLHYNDMRTRLMKAT